MKLFLISQKQNRGYDTYDSAVVVAIDEEAARQLDPGTGKPVEDWSDKYSAWCSGPEHVIVTHIGEAAAGVEPGVVCASFNAG